MQKQLPNTPKGNVEKRKKAGTLQNIVNFGNFGNHLQCNT